MPNSGTATNTHNASAAVVESDPVGGSKPGMTVPSAASATNRKCVPRKPMYFSGCFSPTSSICFPMPVTTISRRFCQRDRFIPVESLRVTSLEPTASTSISPQVNTIVPFSLKTPCCQKIIWSGLRRMNGLLGCGFRVLGPRAGQSHQDESRDDKSDQACDHPFPMPAPDEIKPGQSNAHPQQAAANEP